MSKRPSSRRTPDLLLAALLVLGSTTAEAGVGLFKLVQGPVSVLRGGQTLPASVGMAVEAADVIVTGDGAVAGLGFSDNSRLSLGPRSRLVLDRYQFDTTTHEGRFDASLSQGKLAVVSGKIAKHKTDAMTVGTPSSILGVRGTEFVVEVGAAP
ncbi:MAG: FecR domain-containing protein [Stagnimonas sp.]|nr:FecR domain-containing protein [Stagnimonas sp.]